MLFSPNKFSSLDTEIYLSHLTFHSSEINDQDLVGNEHMSLYSEENPMFTFLFVDILINNLSAMFAL